MIFDTLRVYDRGTFHDVPPPDWYTEACRLCEDGLDWYRALDRVLDCEAMILADEGSLGGWIEIRYWPSSISGTFVLIETQLGPIEQVLILEPTDWLPFLTHHLLPLLALAAQTAQTEMQRRIGNAIIAYIRHGTGEHIDRESGASVIDIRRDGERWRRQRASQTPG